MKRRAFFKSLVAVAAIAFARPLALINEPVINPEWRDAPYELTLVGIDQNGHKAVSPILIRFRPGKDGILYRVWPHL